MKNRHPLVAAAVAAILLPLALAAPAQQAPAPAPEPAGAAGGELDEVFVTARRRAESVQEVPVAVSVVDAAKLEATGTFNVDRLQQLQPSLQWFSSNPRNTAVTIRGFGSAFGLTNDGIEQGVGLYVDDVFYSRVASSTLDFLDVDRIEVLRGPQGTLYGKNTTAGAVNITTRAPTFTTEGVGEISIGSLGFQQLKGSLSGPLVDDRLAARLAVSATTRKGAIYNTASQHRINGLDNVGVRGQLLWRVNDDLDVTFVGDYNLQDADCCAQIFVRVGTTQAPIARQYWALAALQNYAPPSTNAFDRLTDVDAKLASYNEIGGAAIRAVWDVGPGTLTSVTAWRYWDWGPANDRDFTGLQVFTKVNNPTYQEQYTQEFRYAASAERFDYVVGLFGFTQDIQTDGITEVGNQASKWLLAQSSPDWANPASLDGLVSNNDIHTDSSSVALFGQLTWRLTDQLRIEPGLRINYDEKKAHYISVVTNATNTPLTSSQIGVLTPQAYAASFSDWNVSGNLALSYQITSDVLAYVSYATSFKTAGINLNGVPFNQATQQPLVPTTIEPEEVAQYEAGLKTQFLDRRATLNLTGWWTQVDDFQTQVSSTDVGGTTVRGFIANAEKVEAKGVELEFSINPTENWNAYTNVAYTDHEYSSFTNAPCPPELAGGAILQCDISGQWLPGISKWALSYGVQYDIPSHFLGASGKFFLGFDGSYRSRFSSNASRSIYTDISSRALANFRLGFNSEAGWDAFAWVWNAFDKEYFDQLAIAGSNNGLIVGQPATPRTWGVTLRARF